MLYRITPEEHKQIEEFQRSHPQFKLLLGRRTGTDHDHKTGLIKGILDWRINKGYGLLEKACPDNLREVLLALAEFQARPPAITVLGEKRYGLIGLAKKKKVMIYGPPISSHKGTPK